MIKRYGLVIDKERDPESYVLGASPLPKVVIREDGQWDKFLPEYEPKFNEFFDSFGCTVWGTLNVIETLIKQATGVEQNYSERFTYILARVRPPGADPHRIAEVIRDKGVIPEALLPMTATQEFLAFLRPDPMSKNLLEEGEKFPYEVKHEYLWNRQVNKKERTAIMKEALRYSPLGISVTAWYRQNGVYVDKGQPNTHWCMCYGWNIEGWLIFDSYDQSHKILSYDHNIEVAKRYHLELNNRLPRMNILRKMINVLLEMVGLIEKTPTPVPTPAPLRDKIAQEAVRWLGKDASPGNLAPEELACAESVSHILQEAGVKIPTMISTAQLDAWLNKSKDFIRTTEAKPGTIIMSPTGKGNGQIPNGHVGIFKDNNSIMSNDSGREMWLENYTISTWVNRYRTRGGYPIYYYECVV